VHTLRPHRPAIGMMKRPLQTFLTPRLRAHHRCQILIIQLIEVNSSSAHRVSSRRNLEISPHSRRVMEPRRLMIRARMSRVCPSQLQLDHNPAVASMHKIRVSVPLANPNKRFYKQIARGMLHPRDRSPLTCSHLRLTRRRHQ
jgi:hypothetical protein